MGFIKKTRLIFFLVLYLLFFAGVYWVLANYDSRKHFRVGWDPKGTPEFKKYVSFFDCFYFAVITQSTIGFGEMAPSTVHAKIAVLFQSFTLLLIILFNVKL